MNTSASSATDPRDGGSLVAAAVTSSAAVTDPRDGTATVSGTGIALEGLLNEAAGGPVLDEAGAFILAENGA